MKITTTETIAGRLVEDTLGVVRGTVLWSRRVMKYNHGGLRGLQYTTMDEMSDGLHEAKEQAEAKAKAQAKALGADAIISMRIDVVELSDGVFTAVASGTAVQTCALPSAMPAFCIAANDDEFSSIPVFERPSLRLVSNMMH